MSSSLTLVTAGPCVGEETNLSSALSAADVTDEVACGCDLRTELCCSILSLPTLFRCILKMAVFKMLHTGEAGSTFVSEWSSLQFHTAVPNFKCYHTLYLASVQMAVT